MGAEHESRPDYRPGPRPLPGEPSVRDGRGRTRARGGLGAAELRRR
jgi:hypothetical protein